MTFEGTLEKALMGGKDSYVLRTATGMTYELVDAPRSAEDLVGSEVTVRGELAPEQFGFVMAGPRLTVAALRKRA